jgi:DNA-binding NarL/FixJ family response regulator
VGLQTKALKEMNGIQMSKVLIVDDDMRFSRFVKELFSSEESLQIIGEAADGQEAIRKAKELKPDLVLMDITMPRMSGLDATRRLKKIMPELTIIILTVHNIEEYREAAMASGASAYVLKKTMIEDLIPAIRMSLP